MFFMDCFLRVDQVGGSFLENLLKEKYNYSDFYLEYEG